MQQDGLEYQIQARISAFPHYKSQDQSQLLRSFQNMGVSTPPVNADQIKRDRERLRQLVGKRKV